MPDFVHAVADDERGRGPTRAGYAIAGALVVPARAAAFLSGTPVLTTPAA